MIRPFTEDDYAPMIALWNQLNPDSPRTVEEERDYDAKAGERFHRARFVAEVEGAVAGVAECGTNPGAYHPRRFEIEVNVEPTLQGRGIGKALYGRLLEYLHPFDPLSLRVAVRENQPRALRFFHHRGFAETKRDWVSVLDVAGADLSPYDGLETALAPVRIHSFAEMRARHPDADRRLHTLFSEVRLDTPRTEPATPVDFEFFVGNCLTGSDFDPAAFFVAVDGDAWVGLTGLYPIGESRALFQWLTGVRRDHRGRRVAMALKVRTIRFAREHGFETIRTDNDSLNRPMLAINEKLGFVRGAAQVSLRKVLAEES